MKRMDLPQRKKNRLDGYDYSSCGLYFVTLCVKDRHEMLWDVGARIARPQESGDVLSKYGQAIDLAIRRISACYPSVEIDNYVIMPNHVHMLIRIRAHGDGRAMRAPTISNVVNQMKGAVTKQIGFSLWQKLFHDHIVRDEREYQKIWQYIDTNPINWKQDCFYAPIELEQVSEQCDEGGRP